MSVLDDLKDVPLPQTGKRRQPLWEGPNGDGDNGGVTQGLLQKFLTCPERARIHLMNGLKPVDRFNHRLEYGNFFHLCEEHHSQGQDWSVALAKHAQALLRQWPLDQHDILKWHNACKVQFPIWLEWKSRHPDHGQRVSLLAEQTFRVPLTLPSGRVVQLRGKWDGVELATVCGRRGIWLVEHKSKGNPDEQQIKRQLTRDLQTLLYLVALTETPCADLGSEEPILGVRYQVVRRPLSGGKGTIVQHQATKGSKCPKCKGVGGGCPKCKGVGRIGGKPAESLESFFGRLDDAIRENQDEFFMCWDVSVTDHDVERFQRECLTPILENLCDAWEWWLHCHESAKLKQAINLSGDLLWETEARKRWWSHHCPRHFLMPFGVTSPLLDGGTTELDNHIATGSTSGLVQNEVLYPELQ